MRCLAWQPWALSGHHPQRSVPACRPDSDGLAAAGRGDCRGGRGAPLRHLPGQQPGHHCAALPPHVHVPRVRPGAAQACVGWGCPKRCAPPHGRLDSEQLSGLASVLALGICGRCTSPLSTMAAMPAHKQQVAQAEPQVLTAQRLCRSCASRRPSVPSVASRWTASCTSRCRSRPTRCPRGQRLQPPPRRSRSSKSDCLPGQQLACLSGQRCTAMYSPGY